MSELGWLNVEGIEHYDRERRSEKLDTASESEIQQCLRLIADKPHRAHLYLRDLVTRVKNSTPKIHGLKTWPDAFEKVMANTKTAEWRKNDRNFKVGDHLMLQEWDPVVKGYTGRTVVRVVTDVTGSRFSIPEGYVMMSIRPPNPADTAALEDT